MKNTDNISFDPAWWAHKDHKLTSKIDKKDREAFLKLIKAHGKLDSLDYKDWSDIILKCKSIAKIASHMRLRSDLSQRTHEESIEALQIIGVRASGRVERFKKYISYVKDQAEFFENEWSDSINLTTDPFKAYFKSRSMEDEYNWYARTVDSQNSIGMREDVPFLRDWLNLPGREYTKLENAFADRRSGRVGVPLVPNDPNSALNIEESQKLWKKAVFEVKKLLNQVWKRKSDKATYIKQLFVAKYDLDWNISLMQNFDKVPGV